MDAAKKSSWIARIDYDPVARTVQLTTHRRSVYIVRNIAPTVFEQWVAAASWGEFFNNRIKPWYACTVDRTVERDVPGRPGQSSRAGPAMSDLPNDENGRHPERGVGPYL